MRKKLFLFMSLMLFLLGYSVNAMALPPASGGRHEGIDVSQWQGNIDFEQAAAAGIRVVYIRSSLGSSYVDPYFEQNYQRAKATGMKVGFYHYVTARTQSQARYQAQFFVNTVRGKAFQCRLAMDFEDLTGLSAGEANQIGLAFIQAVETLSGKGAVVYSDTSNAGSVFGGGLTAYPLWAAEYGVSQLSSAVNWSSWAGWQYSDQGQIPGISGYVDRDVFTDAMFLESPGKVKPVKRPRPSSQMAVYRVQPGDTLWAIARKYRVSTAAIVRENRLANPDLIYPGQVLRIPVRDDGPEADHYYYTVRSGDTLSQIARRYGTSAARLAAENGIANPSLIYPGQVLRVS